MIEMAIGVGVTAILAVVGWTSQRLIAKLDRIDVMVRGDGNGTPGIGERVRDVHAELKSAREAEATERSVIAKELKISIESNDAAHRSISDGLESVTSKLRSHAAAEEQHLTDVYDKIMIVGNRLDEHSEGEEERLVSVLIRMRKELCTD